MEITLSFILLLCSSIVAISTIIKSWRLTPDQPNLHILITATLPAIYQFTGFLVLDLDGKYIDTIYVNNTVSSMAYGAIIISILQIFATLAYLNINDNAKNYICLKRSLKNQNLIITSSLILVLIGIFLFAKNNQISILEFLLNSSKQLKESSSNLVEFESDGYLRLLIGIGTPVFLFYFAYYLYQNQWNTRRRLVVMILFIAAAYPQYALSARGSLLYSFIAIFFMLIILKKLTPTRLILGLIIVTTLFSLATSARLNDGETIDILYGLSQRVFYGGGISLFNTSYITENFIQNGIPYKYGASLLGLATAFIPRSIWPEKPVFAYDQEIARSVYGITGFGFQAIPAGLPIELLMNFGFIFSVIVYSLILLIIKKIYTKSITLEDGFLSLIIRSIIIPKLISKLFASGIGFAVMDTLVIAIPVFLIYKFGTRKNQ